MQYETLFWSMAGVLVISVAVFAAIIGFTRQGELENQAVMLAITAFMFCLVIATAAALLTRRIIRTT